MLKVLSKFDEAIACCTKQLNNYEELDDKVLLKKTNLIFFIFFFKFSSFQFGKYRAFFSLGTIYYAKGKNMGHLVCKTPSAAAEHGENAEPQTSRVEFPEDVKTCFSNAVHYFRFVLNKNLHFFKFVNNINPAKLSN